MAGMGGFSEAVMRQRATQTTGGVGARGPERAILAPNSPSDEPKVTQDEKSPKTPVSAPEAKEKLDFGGVESFATARPPQNSSKKPSSKDDQVQGLVDRANSALGGGDGSNVEKELEELEKFSEEDLKLANDLIFEGSAQKDYTVGSTGVTIRIASSRAEENDIVDEMMYNYIKSHNAKDGDYVDLPRNKAVNYEKMIRLSLAYVGKNGEDMAPEAKYKLSTIKRGIEKMLELMYSGDIDQFDNIRKAIFDSIEKRASLMRKLHPAFIDAIHECKYEFDRKMFDVMSTKNIIPKS